MCCDRITSLAGAEGSEHTPRMWIRALGTAVAAAALSSCATSHDQVAHTQVAAEPSDSIDELSSHHGKFCPTVLPRASRATYGFGDDRPAATAPTLPKPDEAWICRYDSRNVAPEGSNGAWLEWTRQDAPRRLDDDEMKVFSSAVQHLQPIAGDIACTSDLGPRYLVSYANRNDLTGVVIDRYGCGEIRLTDDPFNTVPGDPSQPGTVTGVLGGPAGLLDELNAR